MIKKYFLTLPNTPDSRLLRHAWVRAVELFYPPPMRRPRFHRGPTDSDSECSYVANLADFNVIRVIIIIEIVIIIVIRVIIIIVIKFEKKFNEII